MRPTTDWKFETGKVEAIGFEAAALEAVIRNDSAESNEEALNKSCRRVVAVHTKFGSDESFQYVCRRAVGVALAMASCFLTELDQLHEPELPDNACHDLVSRQAFPQRPEIWRRRGVMRADQSCCERRLDDAVAEYFEVLAVGSLGLQCFRCWWSMYWN